MEGWIRTHCGLEWARFGHFCYKVLYSDLVLMTFCQPIHYYEMVYGSGSQTGLRVLALCPLKEQGGGME